MDFKILFMYEVRAESFQVGVIWKCQVSLS